MRPVIVLVSLLAIAACDGGGGAPTDAPPDGQMCVPPVGFTLAAIGERSFASFGWTGTVHNVAVQDGTPVGVKVNTCDGCDGLCSFEGPTEPEGSVSRRRCLNRTSRSCQTDNDCPADGTPYRKCVFIYDAPVGTPLVGAGGLEGACGWSYIPIAGIGEPPTVSGTLDQTTGELNITGLRVLLPLNGSSGTYRGTCAECVGDPIANDGVKGGTCTLSTRGQQFDESPDLGQPCDIHRFGNLPGYEGGYSMDCSPTVRMQDGQPSEFGGLFTSSGFKLTIDEDSPDCTDPAFAGEKCFCGACPDGVTSCLTNADCGGAQCGYLPPTCDPNPPPFRDDGTLNPSFNPSFAPHQCRAAGTTMHVTTGGNTCRNNVCNWNPMTGLGTCISKLTNKPVGCYPHGLGAEIVAPGRVMRLGSVYIADTGNARCNRITPSAAFNGQLGLPGVTFQKRSFRIVPTEAPK